IDVLVNNAASFYAGYFEELTPEQMERQLTTSLIGPMNVTRAVLPVMRKQRSGHVVTISSSAGLAGFGSGTAYATDRGVPERPLAWRGVKLGARSARHGIVVRVPRGPSRSERRFSGCQRRCCVTAKP